MSNLGLNNDALLVIFVGVTALAFLIQAFVMLGVLFAVRKGTKAIQEEMQDLRSVVTPLVASSQKLIHQVGPNVEAVVASTRELIVRVTPKVESTMTDLAGVASNLREESEKLSGATLEIMEKVRLQSGRIDSMLTELLDNLNRAGACFVEAVNKPIRQVQGIVSSIRAAVDTLNNPVPPRQPRSRNDDAPYV
jgi:hypothetical protein